MFQWFRREIHFNGGTALMRAYMVRDYMVRAYMVRDYMVRA